MRTQELFGKLMMPKLMSCAQAFLSQQARSVRTVWLSNGFQDPAESLLAVAEQQARQLSVVPWYLVLQDLGCIMSNADKQEQIGHEKDIEAAADTMLRPA